MNTETKSGPKYKEGDILFWAGHYYGNPCIFQGKVFEIVPSGVVYTYTLTGVEWKVLYENGWGHWACPDGPGEAYMDCQAGVSEQDLHKQEGPVHRDVIRIIKEDLKRLIKVRQALCNRLKIVREGL